jgi:hypothetical protein
MDRIQTVVRIRPLSSKEQAKKETTTVSCDGQVTRTRRLSIYACTVLPAPLQIAHRPRLTPACRPASPLQPLVESYADRLAPGPRVPRL